MRILLTADIHIGMRFGSYPEDVAGRLQEARFGAVTKALELAGTRACDLVVVAGDLFDRVALNKSDIERTAGLFAAAGRCPVAVLPGNHDFAPQQGSDLWKLFQAHAGGNVLVLDQARPRNLAEFGLDATLFPGPCTSKHSSTHALGWVADAPKPREGLAIGVAHGTLEGTAADVEGTYYPVSAGELAATGVRVWLTGHVHAPFCRRTPQDVWVVNPGTPEPDGADCTHAGAMSVVEIRAPGEVNVEQVTTGVHRFVRRQIQLDNPADVDRLPLALGDGDHRTTLLSLTLRGRLSGDDRKRAGEALDRLRSQVLHLAEDTSGLQVLITQAKIDQEFSEGSPAHALLSELARDPADSAALQLAYDLVKEVAQ